MSLARERILSAIEVVFYVTQHGFLNGRSRVFIIVYMCRVHHVPQNDRWCYSSLSLDGVRQHFETLPGIFPGLIIVGVAPFRRSLGVVHEQLRRLRAIMTAKQNIESKLTVFFSKSTLRVLLSYTPLSQLVFNNEGRFC